jgi:hypothetical protein
MVQVAAEGHMTESGRGIKCYCFRSDCCQIWFSRRGQERKVSFIENNIPRRDDPACVNAKAVIATMICRITEEDAGRGSGTEFVRHCRCLIGETKTAKNSQMAV